MDDKELINLILEKNEWQSFECKRAAIKPAKLIETVSAFSNTNGGIIALGLEDPKKFEGRNRLVGISENPDNVSEFLKLTDKELAPPIFGWTSKYVDITNTNKKQDQLLLIFIEKSNDVHSLKNGNTYVRKGNQNVKIGAVEIQNLQYEKGLRKYEDEISKITDLQELSQKLFNQYKKDTDSNNEDEWQFLKDNGLAHKKDDVFTLTKAGVLLFGKNPTVLLKSKCGIKISHYYGTKPTYSGEPNFVEKPFTVEGPLMKQIDDTMEYFNSIVKKSPPKLSGSVFKPSLLIPAWAFQEAVTNAVIHRNYYIEDDVQIRIFDDRIEIESPGTYPGKITVNNIRNERFARNPMIQRVLNRFQESPNLDIGEGVDRMFKIMKEHNLYEPLYFPQEIRPNSVLVILLSTKRVEYWDIISQYLDENHYIKPQKAREITGVMDSVEMSRLFGQWVNSGILEQAGKSKKGSYYIKPGTILEKDLLLKHLKINPKSSKNALK
ncbi:putative DNA binding domain-containing protein [Patescibacteria group bacterium]|nr:putative DNA binding domain-containing protein [Patescibacteria group bacterium]MBU4142290.1 putative DNA binding domain-containing protein [Patescibacteria group bacterium]MBU4339088.1 putative DNA binding domain-containing protein [Patescibacteria group bacterium]MCG2694780.1 putative DNA binding domain-containing protein [Candidatus Parcubacteria bacterium]